MQGWSDSTEPAAQAVIAGTLTPQSLSITSARIHAARLALQLEADFVNAAIAAAQACVRAALPPRPRSPATAPRVLDLPSLRTASAPALACTPSGLLLSVADGLADSAPADQDAAADVASPVVLAPPPAQASAPTVRATVSGVAVEPLAVTFSFSAPRRAPVADEVVGAAAADSADAPGVLGRAMSSLLAIAGISAANLTLPGFTGPQPAADPVAVAQMWAMQAQTAMRMVRLVICVTGLSSPVSRDTIQT